MIRKRYGDKAIATKLFIETYYGDEKELKAALKQDWYAVQYEWEVFMDSLCKNGDITDEQYNTWVFPWPKREV